MDVKAYWETPAATQANQRDVILKQLEIQTISHYIKDGMRVLDVGCGSGETAIELAKHFEIDITGMDSSEAMIVRARIAREEVRPELRSYPEFFADTILTPFKSLADPTIDLAYSERCLINLQGWQAQKQAIEVVISLLKPGGLFLMCEHSQEGLDTVNWWRAQVDLPAIEPPWHNVYIRDDNIKELLGRDDFHLAGVDEFSGIYYWLSRVINARLAADEGREPDYDAPINKLALKLPNAMGVRGQARCWIWKRDR